VGALAQVIHVFPGSGNTERLLGILACSGISQSKDGGHLPEVDRKLRISQLVYMIATTFQRLHPCFRGQATRIDYWNLCMGMSSIKEGGHSPEVIMSILPMHY